jgi:hypothetical protein
MTDMFLLFRLTRQFPHLRADKMTHIDYKK